MTFEYELTSKRLFFLWLYQVVPNIDIIKYIYDIKCNLEEEDTLFYYGIMPRITFIHDSNYSYTMNFALENNRSKKILNSLALYIKMVTTQGLICKFTQPLILTKLEEELMHNGFWEFYAIEVNDDPKLKEKINCINKILEEGSYLLDDIYEKLHNLSVMYDSNMYGYVHHDHEIDFIRIGIDEEGGWHIPSIHF